MISLCSWWERSVEESFGRKCCNETSENGEEISPKLSHTKTILPARQASL